MDEETALLISKVLDLGLVGVLAVQTIVLYRALTTMTDRYLAHLERISERVTSLTQPLSIPPFLADGATARPAASDNDHI